eukprot:CAMPEP_0184703784 /NCGR_PEP_ID=MMETSP0313-20130426/28934_1 /TAXON_ID=2792 /ORGANISM="Porphyridium aerugineum, Strain SAG 1380-2" /LENGTH=171 /DNA_ID=CAMNT_0027164633 /DNA_START=14 /DNA_END=526 /DNA_ORIENTATION=+
MAEKEPLSQDIQDNPFVDLQNLVDTSTDKPQTPSVLVPEGCFDCLNLAWFCFTPGYQVQYYYMTGTLDQCAKQYKDLKMCFSSKLKKYEDSKKMYEDYYTSLAEKSTPDDQKQTREECVRQVVAHAADEHERQIIPDLIKRYNPHLVSSVWEYKPEYYRYVYETLRERHEK